MSLAGRHAAVVIGRNEGGRLGPALASVVGLFDEVVYVDSASSDGSIDVASGCGAAVVCLPADGRLSAARARNAGFRTLREPAAVFFMDGDCTADDGFVAEAVGRLGVDDVVAVCGVRVERDPTRNWFHRICAIEWRSGHAGDVEAFGGDVVVDAAAFAAVGGYDEALVAGEDPELSARLRDAGGRIVRLERPSTTHDIDMTHVRQWWKRAERAGWAYGAVYWKRRTSTRPMYRREVIRLAITPTALLLGLLALLKGWRLPIVLVVARSLVGGVRAARQIDAQHGVRDRLAWGTSCAVAPIPGALGLARSLRSRGGRRAQGLIEYR